MILLSHKFPVPKLGKAPRQQQSTLPLINKADQKNELRSSAWRAQKVSILAAYLKGQVKARQIKTKSSSNGCFLSSIS